MQASQIFEIVIVTLIFSDVVPQLKLNAFCVSDTETSLLPYFTLLNHIVQFSRCCFQFRLKPDFKAQTNLDFEIQQQALFGGPEWARTTDLTIISRTL